jgi:hypothetical protein
MLENDIHHEPMNQLTCVEQLQEMSGESIEVDGLTPL